MRDLALSVRDAFDEIAGHIPADVLAESAFAFSGDWNGQPYTPSAQEQPGVYAWGEAHLLLAFMLQYEATGNLRYLEAFLRRFDMLLALRDDLHERVDVLRGRMMPSWGSVRFSGEQYTCWLVHAGMLLYPAARFLRLAAKQNAPRERFAVEIARLLPAMQETIAAYDVHWQQGPADDEGYYTEPAMPDDHHLPLNQQNIMGRVMLELAPLPGCEAYRERVARLAASLKHRLLPGDGDSYCWAYRPPLAPPFDQSGAEDISHAAMNVDFAVRCHEEGIVFTAEDVQRFSRTLIRVIHRSDGSIADNVDGSGEGNRYRNVLVYWGRLALYDREVARIIRQVVSTEPTLAGPVKLLTLAMLGCWEWAGI